MFCRLEKFDGPILRVWGRGGGAYIWDANWIACLEGVYSGEGQLMYNHNQNI